SQAETGLPEEGGRGSEARPEEGLEGARPAQDQGAREDACAHEEAREEGAAPLATSARSRSTLGFAAGSRSAPALPGIEERPGFAGALRALGGLGGHFGAPQLASQRGVGQEARPGRCGPRRAGRRSAGADRSPFRSSPP